MLSALGGLITLSAAGGLTMLSAYRILPTAYA